MRRALAVAVACVIALACTKTERVTEVVLVVDTDLAAPADIDDVTIAVDGPNGFHADRDARVGAGAPPFPLTLGVEASSAGERATISVVGKRSGQDVVVRKAVMTFVDAETRMLRVSLCKACIGRSCPGDATCVQGTCISPSVDGALLPAWPGAPPGRDGCQEPPPPSAPPNADGGGGGGGDGGTCTPIVDVSAGGAFDVWTCGPTFTVCSGKTVPCAIIATQSAPGGRFDVQCSEPDIDISPVDGACNSVGGAVCGGPATAHVTAGRNALVCLRAGPCKTVRLNVTHL